jgi:hypothetical protein
VHGKVYTHDNYFESNVRCVVCLKHASVKLEELQELCMIAFALLETSNFILYLSWRMTEPTKGFQPFILNSKE